KPSPITIKNLVDKFTRSENVANDYHFSYPLSATNHIKQEATISALQENLQQSTNQLAMKLNVSPSSIRKILKIHKFHPYNEVNKHNCRYLSKENKYIMRTDNTQYSQKINVWAGIINNFIISPFFIKENLNGPKYLEMLQNLIIPELNNLFSENEVIFQQDGAPAYFSKDVHKYLNKNFQIGR
ncbi:18898_t:CDS:2, partial [Dentiscutata erythropus]